MPIDLALIYENNTVSSMYSYFFELKIPPRIILDPVTSFCVDSKDFFLKACQPC